MDKEEEKDTPLLSFDFIDDSDEKYRICFMRWFVWSWRWLKKRKHV